MYRLSRMFYPASAALAAAAIKFPAAAIKKKILIMCFKVHVPTFQNVQSFESCIRGTCSGCNKILIIELFGKGERSEFQNSGEWEYWDFEAHVRGRWLWELLPVWKGAFSRDFLASPEAAPACVCVCVCLCVCVRVGSGASCVWES